MATARKHQLSKFFHGGDSIFINSFDKTKFSCLARGGMGSNRAVNILGNLRSYDGNCKGNVTLKLNFVLSQVSCHYSMLITFVQNRRNALLLAQHEWFSCKGKKMKDLLQRARVVVTTSNVKISRRRLADYVKTLHQKACCTCCTIIFLHWTNQISDLWRCRWRCNRHILNSLLIGYKKYKRLCVLVIKVEPCLTNKRG